ncbi:MAG: KOW domain-containing RNA-binding protein [Oscillospiraceae bacterium]|nr:KOW domain-containing RNA-binding protein [Oscillospiraceae bacterium]
MEKELKFTLAISFSGHDKGSWYIIVKRESGKDLKDKEFVYIADGRRRKLENPKRKNIKHVKITRKFVELEYYTDKCLRKALWNYNFGDGSKNEGENGQ